MSGSCVRVNSVAYYSEAAKKAAMEALQFGEQSDAEGKEAGIGGPTPSAALGYYDNEDDAPGKWWSSTSIAPNTFTQGNFVTHGSKVSGKEIVMLAEQGRHPVTGEQLVQIQKKGKKKIKGKEVAVDKRTVAFDFQLSLPKDASALWAAAETESIANGNPEAKRIAEGMPLVLEAAVDRMLKYVYENGLLIARYGKGSKQSVGAAEWAASKFLHHTSRAGDPHLHIHSVIANACVRPDGTTGTLDNIEMLRHMGEMTALFRAEVASQLKEKFGIECEKVDRNWEFKGFDRSLTDKWSKRRAEILAEMAKFGIDGTANNRESAIHINRNTRQDKSQQPELSELKKRWKVEMQSLGHSFTGVMEAIHEAADKSRAEKVEAWELKVKEAAENGIELPSEMPAYDKEQIKTDAIKALTEFNSTFEERTLRREFYEAAQVHCNADEAIALLEEFKAENHLVKIGMIGSEAVYSTTEIIECEREMLRTAQTMKDNVEALDRSVVDEIIKRGVVINEQGDTAPYRPEQINLILAATGTNQLQLGEGRAGSGKSASTRAIAAAFEASGYTNHAMAPSWKATGVLKTDAEIAEEYARAITGWLNAYDRGEIVVNKKTALIIDEAGMVGLQHMARLVEIANATGARMVLLGDPRQLQPVAAGAPMKAIASFNGSAILEEIARQKVEWQRQASMDFSKGNVAAALGEYIKFGNVKFLDGDEARLRVIAECMDDKAKNPKDSFLILTTTNGDARRINNGFRAARYELGELSGDEVLIDAVSRGKNGRVVEIGFAKGDRIILGETLTIGGQMYINNSTGTLLEVRKPKGKDAVFVIKWDDGRILEAATPELVGYRKENAKDINAPKISHSYAVTVHSSQGMTVDRTYVYNAKGFSLELLYVAMTRHRKNAKMYVDKTRIEDGLKLLGGIAIRLTKGKGKLKQKDDEGETLVTDEMIKNKLISESSKSQLKLNVCDFQENNKEWLSSPFDTNKEYEKETTMTDKKDQEKTQSETPKFLMGQRSPFAKTPFVRGLGETGNKPEAVKERMEARAAAKQESRAAAQKASTKKPVGGLLAPAEIDVLVRENLVDYMLINGASYKKGEKQGREITDKFSGGKAYEHTLTFGKGDGVVVIQKANGTWGFFSRGREKGDIRNFRQWRDGGSFGAACASLREEFKTIGLKDTSAPYSRPERPAPVMETTKERFDRILSDSYVAEKFEKIRAWWNEASVAVSGYLLSRGIEKETQAAFRKDFRCEGDETYDGQNKRGVMFAMRDSEANLTGFLRKGPKQSESADRDFSKNADGTERHMVVMGDPMTAKRAYVGEAPIDGMSLFQKDGRPTDSVILATSGSAPEKGMALLYKVAKENPSVEWHYVGQNDDPHPKTKRKADEDNEEKVREAITEGNPEAVIETRRPPERFKDWNDELQGIERKRPLTAEERAAREAAREDYERQKEKAVQDAKATAEAAQNGPERGM